MITNKKKFFTGLGLMAVFIVVLALMFSPLFKGKNALEYSDALYNSISKGSAYYIPQAKNEAAKIDGAAVSLSLDFHDEGQASRAAKLFAAAGVEASAEGPVLKVEGDIGGMLASCLEDADAMYANDGGKVSGRYGFDERRALYDWWTALKLADADLKRQKRFKEAKTVSLVKKKAVETAYNYYGITPQKITDRLGIVIFSLIFYVIYTVWYGFAILFMFEGLGLSFGH